MSDISVIVVSLLAAVGIIYIAVSFVESVFRDDVKKSVTLIKGDSHTLEMLRAARRLYVISNGARILVVCDKEERRRAKVDQAEDEGVIAIDKSEIPETVGYFLDI